MENYSLKISNYKCFGDTPEGFQSIKPINIIIGRNNTGKSSLLDLIAWAILPFNTDSLGHNRKHPRVYLSTTLSESQIRNVFTESRAGGGIPGNNHYEYGKKWIDSKITIQLSQDPNDKKSHGNAFINIEPPFDVTVGEYQEQLARIVGNPFTKFKFKRLLSDRDINPEQDSEVKVKPNGDGATNIIQKFINKVVKLQ